MNFAIKNKSEEITEIDIFGEIGQSWFTEGITMQTVKDKIQNLSTPQIILNISSLGGDVDHALAIYDILKMHKAQITSKIIGATASSGTIIALAGDRIEMSENALFLVHNAWTMAVGNAEDLRATAESLDKFDSRIINIYKKKTGKRENTITNLMAEEKWITAEEAKDFGFIDSVFTPTKAAASVDFKRFENSALPKLPEKFINKFNNDNMDNKEITSTLNSWGEKIMNALKGKKEEEKVDVTPLIETAKAEIKNEFENKFSALNTELETVKTDKVALQSKVSEQETEITNLKAEVSKFTAAPVVVENNEGSNPEGNQAVTESVFDFAAQKIRNRK